MTKPKVMLHLQGPEGNVFCIIGKVSEALRRAGQVDKAKEFMDKAFNSPSYQAVLDLCDDYVDTGKKRTKAPA